MPSVNYNDSLPLFENLFATGIAQCVQPIAMTGYKIVQGVSESDLKPYYSSPFPQRAKNSGDFTIFLGDKPETSSCELFGNSGFSGAPENTWCLRYYYEGQMFNVMRSPDENFKSNFLRWSGDAKHEFSQDFKYFLQQKGFTAQCDSIGWGTVSGERVGLSGFIIAWHSGESGVFRYEDKFRIA